jgi:hypothetical protein
MLTTRAPKPSIALLSTLYQITILASKVTGQLSGHDQYHGPCDIATRRSYLRLNAHCQLDIIYFPWNGFLVESMFSKEAVSC